MIQVITHDGKFHPDEIYACVLLQYFTKDELSFTRTRDMKLIENAQFQKSTYVIDVGGVYDPLKNNYDHHQSTFTDVGLEGDLLSSCGLMWRKFRDSSGLSEFVKNKIDEFTIKVDKHDNGKEYFNEIEFISLYNYAFEYKSQNTRFKRAYASAVTHFANMMNMWEEFHRKEEKAKEILKTASGGIICTDEKIGVNPIFNKSDNLLLVSPRKGEEYTVCSLNIGEEVDFSIRCPAPISWRALTDDELVEVSKINGMVFCHKTGFITVVNGKENAMQVANAIIQWNKQEGLM